MGISSLLRSALAFACFVTSHAKEEEGAHQACWKATTEEASLCREQNCGNGVYPFTNDNGYMEQYPLTSELFNLSVPYMPSTLSLQRALAKAERGEELVVAVIGGSMTIGTYCKEKWGPKAADVTIGLECSWQTRLYKWLKGRFPKSSVSSRNYAVGACSTVCHTHQLSYRLPLNTPIDIIFIDLGVNDGTLVGEQHKAVEGAGDLREWTEVMIRYLLLIESRPAIVYLEGIFKKSFRESFSVAEQHKEITQTYGIPMISYRHMAWPKQDMQPGTEIYKRRDRMWNVDLHPSWRIHQLFADTITHYIETLYHRMCATGFDTTTDLGVPSLYLGSSADPYPPPPLFSKTAKIWKDLNLPHKPHFIMRGEQGGGLQAKWNDALSAYDVQPPKSWWFTVEKGSKPGFVTEAQPNAVITFKVDCGVGEDEAWLSIGYLRSYKSMGRVNLAVNGTNMMELDGIWDGPHHIHFSVGQFIGLSVPRGVLYVTLTALHMKEGDDPTKREKNKFKVDQISCT